MTKEEAQQLKPGDKIKGNFQKVRTITACKVSDSLLQWSETNTLEMIHSWDYECIDLVEKGEPQVINNYEIY